MSNERGDVYAAPAATESGPSEAHPERRLIAGDLDWFVTGFLLLYAFMWIIWPHETHIGPPPPPHWEEKLPREYWKVFAAVVPTLLALASTFGQVSPRLLGVTPEKRHLRASIYIFFVRSLAPTLGFFTFLSGSWMPLSTTYFEPYSAGRLLQLLVPFCGPWLVVPALAIIVRHTPLHEAWRRWLRIQV